MSMLEIFKAEVSGLLKDTAARQRVDVDRVIALVTRVRQMSEAEVSELGADVAPMLSRALPILERMKALGLPVILPERLIKMLRDRMEAMQVKP